ncbi:SRR1-like protein [Panulirus ornatus]|uniref:SRR1-like protein n=1 Tax=Panulirus ornatus TaxID=150431 RepID=UPI003A88C274
MDPDGFQLVSKKKAARRKHHKKTEDTYTLTQENADECIRKILEAKDVLQSSEGFHTFETNLKNIARSLHVCNEEYKISKIVCFGLGQPSTSRIVKYQTALLLILKDHFNVEVETYDPVYSNVDIRVLEKLSLKVSVVNEEGKRSVKEVTIFFMPHCGKELYNNLLWANWNPISLPQCIIIGNSFGSIVQNVPSRILKQHYKFIYVAERLFKEYPLKSLVEYDDIFNDMSIHVLPAPTANEQEKGIWCKVSEPKYDECDVEIVRVDIEKMTITEKIHL